MGEIHNKKILLSQRRALRRNSTPQELLLWKKLRTSKTGAKFKRQQSILNYIVDFYCASKKLIVEIDGDIKKVVNEIKKTF